MDQKRQARRGLAVYFGALICLSAVFQVLIVKTGEPIGKHLGLVFGLMWVPATASFVARLALREGFGDLSVALPHQAGRALLLAWCYPVAVGGLGYGLAWLTGLSTFSPPLLDAIGVQVAQPAARWIVLLLMALSLGVLYAGVWAAGEQIGWCGYMLTRLVAAGCPRPVLLSGVIWGAWQTPLVITGQYASSAHPPISAALFVVNMTALGYVTARLRLQSGSLFPAVVVHASWNSVMQGVFDVSTRDAGIWAGESGVAVAFCNVVLAAWLARGRWPVRRTPERVAAGEFWDNGAVTVVNGSATEPVT
jgi:uncharacterized protein